MGVLENALNPAKHSKSTVVKIAFLLGVVFAICILYKIRLSSLEVDGRTPPKVNNYTRVWQSNIVGSVGQKLISGVGSQFEESEQSVQQNFNITVNDINAINSIRFVNISEFLRLELGEDRSIAGRFKCRKASISTVNFTICLYNYEEDQWVSGAFTSGGYWERRNVVRLILFTKRIAKLYNNTIGFIDIGANLGGYTLPFAHLGYDVLAIEPNKATATRLAVAIHKGNVAHRVRLLRSAVSDSRETLSLRADLKNRGDTQLRNCSIYPINASKSSSDVSAPIYEEIRKCLNDTVNAVLLDDLTDLVPHRTLIMKIDIQGAEEKALNPKTSSLFFHRNYVPIILMEWETHGLTRKYELKTRGLRLNSNSTSNVFDVSRIKLRKWIRYLVSMNYIAHSVSSGKRLGTDEFLKYTENEVVLIKTELCDKYKWSF